MDNQLLASQTLYYFRDRQETLGVARDTWFVSGLAMYALWLDRKQAEHRLAQAAMLRSVIKTIQEQVAILVNGIAEKPIKEQRDILVQAIHLKEQAERAAIRLEALNVI